MLPPIDNNHHAFTTVAFPVRDQRSADILRRPIIGRCGDYTPHLTTTLKTTQSLSLYNFKTHSPLIACVIRGALPFKSEKSINSVTQKAKSLAANNEEENLDE